MPERPRPYAPRERHLIFSHAQHFDLDAIGDDCSKCHRAPAGSESLEARTPSMASCTACHEHEEMYLNGACERCHLDLSRFALRPVSRFEHQGDFLRTHAGAARTRPDTCATCHDARFCTDCHASTVATRVEFAFPERFDRQMIHRGDWVGRHALEEQRDPMLCARCHASSFCSACHTQAGVTSESAVSLNPHGPGINERSSREFHGAQARRDIVGCAACHDQGASSNCVQCHQVGGVGGTPHPAGWSIRHPQEEIAQNAMCLVCHR